MTAEGWKRDVLPDRVSMPAAVGFFASLPKLRGTVGAPVSTRTLSAATFKDKRDLEAESLALLKCSLGFPRSCLSPQPLEKVGHLALPQITRRTDDPLCRQTHAGRITHRTA